MVTSERGTERYHLIGEGKRLLYSVKYSALVSRKSQPFLPNAEVSTNFTARYTTFTYPVLSRAFPRSL